VVLHKVGGDGKLEPLELPASESDETFQGFDAKPVTEMGFRVENNELAEGKVYNPLLPMDMFAFNLFVMLMFFAVFALTLIVFGWYTFKVKVRASAPKTASGV
jgi:hypothetical protein